MFDLNRSPAASVNGPCTDGSANSSDVNRRGIFGSFAKAGPALLAVMMVSIVYQFANHNEAPAVPRVSSPNVVAPAPRSLRTSSQSKIEQANNFIKEKMAEHEHTKEQEDVKVDAELVEIEMAEELIEEKEEEEEEKSIEELEETAEEDGINDTELKEGEEILEEEANPQEKFIEEEVIDEEKEEIIEEIVEVELDINDWCGDCIWLGVSEYSCTDRLWWIKRYYKVKTDDIGKVALLKDGCNTKNGIKGVFEHGDSGKLLSREGDDES
jgi:hypothetical protein